MLNPEAAAFLRRGRVARLATTDASGQPHIVPIVYAFEGRNIYFALDPKPKRVAPDRLKRIRNILQNPRVAVLVDRYMERWQGLAYLLVLGRAELLSQQEWEQAHAIALLRQKYPQYRRGYPLGEDAPVVKITPEKVVAWGPLEGTRGRPLGQAPAPPLE